jgi:hypothetical protein
MLNPIKCIAPPPNSKRQTSLNGNSNLSKARFEAGNFFNSPNTAWHRVGNSLIVANTNNGNSSVQWNLYGRYIVNPGGLFSCTLLANITFTFSVIMNITWHEVQLGNLGLT